MNLADALVPKQYSDGEQIIRQGDTADGMYFVEDGVVRITILGERGREIEVRICMREQNTHIYSLLDVKTLKGIWMSCTRLFCNHMPILGNASFSNNLL